jgi:hypothetical protein
MDQVMLGKGMQIRGSSRMKHPPIDLAVPRLEQKSPMGHGGARAGTLLGSARQSAKPRSHICSRVLWLYATKGWAILQHVGALRRARGPLTGIRFLMGGELGRLKRT